MPSSIVTPASISPKGDITMNTITIDYDRYKEREPTSEFAVKREGQQHTEQPQEV